jgi:hypothetical protein
VSWPVADLDPIRRLHVMAATLPGAALVETVLDAPFQTVWDFIEDLEHSVPSFDFTVRRAEIVSRVDHQLQLVAMTIAPVRFNVHLDRGWCWMHSRFYVVGMAATPHGSQTRYAHLEGSPQQHAGLLRPFMRQLVKADVRSIRRTLVAS